MYPLRCTLTRVTLTTGAGWLTGTSTRLVGAWMMASPTSVESHGGGDDGSMHEGEDDIVPVSPVPSSSPPPNAAHKHGARLKGEEGAVYTGDQVAGRPEGKGKKVYSDGGWYEGDWVHGHRHGRGVKVDASGDRYEGEWVKDYREGGLRPFVYTSAHATVWSLLLQTGPHVLPQLASDGYMTCRSWPDG